MSTIATTVYTTEEIELSDGTQLTLRPLPIGAMRKFIKQFGTLGEAEDDDAAFSVFTQMTITILNALQKAKEWTTEEVEDTVDLETMKYMFKVSGGIDMDAPKEILTTTDQKEAIGTV